MKEDYFLPPFGLNPLSELSPICLGGVDGFCGGGGGF